MASTNTSCSEIAHMGTSSCKGICKDECVIFPIHIVEEGKGHWEWLWEFPNYNIWLSAFALFQFSTLLTIVGPSEDSVSHFCWCPHIDVGPTEFCGSYSAAYRDVGAVGLCLPLALTLPLSPFLSHSKAWKNLIGVPGLFKKTLSDILPTISC